ncbi:hypothetical protein [Oribacterium sp. WCC10]|uniref:hypothetical protein n=1 Tax=Oribacterium sp. WCC10 TaxID=1855343 RepID=UPI0008EAF5D5|nr:hypothetical protein [Oribacterium sp. WCC10]SFG18584.1 Putative cell wall binding repeat-containing protein [Oribacterium sp. WCC10]
MRYMDESKKNLRRHVAVFAMAVIIGTGMVSQISVFPVYAASTDEKDYAFSSLQWDTGDDLMMAYWDRSEDDQHYKLQLYRDSVAVENKVGPSVTVTNKDYYDFTKLCIENGIGNYIFTVTGLKENETQASETVNIDWAMFHKIEDKYIEEHPKTIFGTYSYDRMKFMKLNDPAATATGKQFANQISNPGQAVNQSNAAVKQTDGWLKLKDADWYHFTGGVMDTGWYTDNATGYKYYFNPDGTMHTGYLYQGGQIYFFDQSGKLCN